MTSYKVQPPYLKNLNILSRAFFGSFDFNSIKRAVPWCGSCAGGAHSKRASLGPDLKNLNP